MTQSSVVNDSHSSAARKKAKTGDTKVLWSPANGTKEESGAGSQDLSTLANSFKQGYGKDLTVCDNGEANEGGKSQSARAQHSASRRKRSLNSGGGGLSAAEEMARSMSPARLAVEVQKARERARQVRFGGGVKPLVAAAGASSIAKLSPPQTGFPTDLRSQPNGTSGGEKYVVANQLSERCKDSPHLTVSAQTKNQSQESCGAPLIDPTTTSKAVSDDAGSHTGLSVAVAPTKLDGLASDPSKPCELTPIVPPIEAVGEKTDVAKGGALASAGNGVIETSALTTKVTHVTKTPSKTALPKRDAAGENVIIKPTLKKLPMSPVRVLTLLLRLRSDVETADVSESKLDGGVEESKGFDPPNSYQDNGVEECKGFDPPNLPPTPATKPSPGPGGAIAGLSASKDTPQTRKTPSPVEVTTSSSIIPLERGQALSLVGQSTWGPSFGISQGSATANALVTANPWIISPDLSALAKNQGRPLARSFPLAASMEQGEKRVSEKRPRISADRPALTASGERNPEDGLTLDAGGDKGDEHGWCRSPDRVRLPNGTHPPVPMSFDVRARLGNDPSKRRCLTAIPGSEADQALQQQQVDAGAANESIGAGCNLDGNLQGLKVDKMTEELLEKLKKEREESIEFDRKLTEALLDL